VNDFHPRLAMDSNGNVMVIWGTGITTKWFNVSNDMGLNWNGAQLINPGGFTDHGFSGDTLIFVDPLGIWTILGPSQNTLDGTIGTDTDILYSRSSDNGMTWTNLQILNSDAAVDGTRGDIEVQIAIDNVGRWITAWISGHHIQIGVDGDLDIFSSSGSFQCDDCDGDGFGFPGEVTCPFGDSPDCDDSDPERSPGQVEVCADGKDNDCDPSTLDLFDTDGDGSLCNVDCDDNNPAVNPSAIEICNSIDDNCDGVIDEGFDNDGDGITTCALPVPDCDDTDPLNFPGNTEICDNQDNNCDTLIDEGFDVDGDGFTTCALPVPDCDDSNPAINPLQVEACTNGLDDDCNAFIDCQETVACSPDNGREPDEVAGVLFAADLTTISWDTAPRADVYDILTGNLNNLRTDGGFSSAFCQAVRVPDTTFAFTEPLAPGDARYFFVRGKGDQCKLGTWGSALRDEARFICP